jgi:quercetin dioxygenase-like cupin family protein
MALNIRRVVTTNNENGKAKVLIDDVAGNLANPRPGVDTVLIWNTDTNPPAVTGDEDNGARMVARAPVKNGTVFRIIEFGPGNESDSHTTQTIDYALILEGEIDMELEPGETVRLRKGDVLVQRATVHNWRNHGTEPCVIAFILIDSQ